MLSELIQSLNKEELRFYKLYAQRYVSGKDGLGGPPAGPDAAGYGWTG